MDGLNTAAWNVTLQVRSYVSGMSFLQDHTILPDKETPMAFQLKTHRSLFRVHAFTLACLFLIAPQAIAQDTPTAPTEKQAEAVEKQAEAVDPFAVPEGANAEELLKFINSVKRQRGNTMETVKRAATAAVAGAEAIRKLDDVPSQLQIAAIREQISALTFLSRVDPKMKNKMSALMKELESSPDPVLARIGKTEAFKAKIAAARTGSADDQQMVINEFKTMVGAKDLDREYYSLGSSLAQSLASSNTELAANFYEELATMMITSSDETIKSRAPNALGSARRLRLPGNEMEITGTMTTGESFDWSSYRGKTVLVDFWASWCGPCRGEVPNMKKNLELYGDQGFAIVGINLDNTLEACDKYVAQENLDWPNLFSKKTGEQGWNNPLVQYYGVSGIPTAILVDKEGKVVSLKARGQELNRLLKDLLGEPKGSTDEDAATTPK